MSSKSEMWGIPKSPSIIDFSECWKERPDVHASPTMENLAGILNGSVDPSKQLVETESLMRRMEQTRLAPIVKTKGPQAPEGSVAQTTEASKKILAKRP